MAEFSNSPIFFRSVKKISQNCVPLIARILTDGFSKIQIILTFLFFLYVSLHSKYPLSFVYPVP